MTKMKTKAPMNTAVMGPNLLFLEGSESEEDDEEEEGDKHFEQQAVAGM